MLYLRTMGSELERLTSKTKGIYITLSLKDVHISVSRQSRRNIQRRQQTYKLILYDQSQMLLKE